MNGYCQYCGQRHDTAVCPPIIVTPPATSGSDTILQDMQMKVLELGAQIDRLKAMLDERDSDPSGWA